MNKKIVHCNVEKFYSIPLRDMVIFPSGKPSTILVGREKSALSVEKTIREFKPIFVSTQINLEEEDFTSKTVYRIGTLCKIIESIKTIDSHLKILVEGISRARIVRILQSKKYFSVKAEKLFDKDISPSDNPDLQALIKTCVSGIEKYSSYNSKISKEITDNITNSSCPREIAYTIASNIKASKIQKQRILEEDNVYNALSESYKILASELADIELQESTQENMWKTQKVIYLREKLKIIQKELGEGEEDSLYKLKNKLKSLRLPKDTLKKCQEEITKLERMNQFSSESGVIRSYLDWIVSLPWNKRNKVTTDIQKAEEILNKNHYALKKVKDRILEFISVKIKSKKSRGSILCLVGAPGVGKTSLAKSIADALNINYLKVSLGGVRDESEIRGHRRTYIGSMPGKIIQLMKKGETINPLILLDEIDKMSNDLRGDPTSAMLEVLDPEQNVKFNDHYLEIDYDLSNVMFIATANNINHIPLPLRDRLEIIRISGYTESEKFKIAKQHLIPKLLTEHGLSGKEFSLSDEALLMLIRKYTFEAGVRGLSKNISKLIRKTVKEIVGKLSDKVDITKNNLQKYVGKEQFNYGVVKEKNEIGVATGLAYTDFGGDLLDIEAVKFNGNGKVEITGKLGEVMKESAKISLSYIRSISKNLDIKDEDFNKYDFHIHVPEGSTPKDGPSAGVGLCISLASCISSLSVERNLAVTGEITLTGKILPIGGLKEKLLAAMRGRITKVLIPKGNEKDLSELPKEISDNMSIILVSNVLDALNHALVKN